MRLPSGLKSFRAWSDSRCSDAPPPARLLVLYLPKSSLYGIHCTTSCPWPRYLHLRGWSTCWSYRVATLGTEYGATVWSSSVKGPCRQAILGTRPLHTSHAQPSSPSSAPPALHLTTYHFVTPCTGYIKPITVSPSVTHGSADQIPHLPARQPVNPVTHTSHSETPRQHQSFDKVPP